MMIVNLIQHRYKDAKVYQFIRFEFGWSLYSMDIIFNIVCVDIQGY